MKRRYVFMLLAVVAVWSYAVGWHVGFKEAEKQGKEAEKKLIAEYSQSIDAMVNMIRPPKEK